MASGTHVQKIARPSSRQPCRSLISMKKLNDVRVSIDLMSRRGTDLSETIRRPRSRTGGTVGRAFTIWLAYVALLLQLAAAGSCGASTSGTEAAVSGPFPICRAQSAVDDVAPGRSDHAPSHHSDCPFCSIHCHTMVVLPSAVGATVPFIIASIATKQPADPVCSTHHFCVGASPRGPPRRA